MYHLNKMETKLENHLNKMETKLENQLNKVETKLENQLNKVETKLDAVSVLNKGVAFSPESCGTDQAGSQHGCQAPQINYSCTRPVCNFQAAADVVTLKVAVMGLQTKLEK
jgi:hypothetical protein